MVVYLQSGDFNEEHDMAINPISLGIDWKVKNYILSDKDKDAIPFKEFDFFLNQSVINNFMTLVSVCIPT